MITNFFFRVLAWFGVRGMDADVDFKNAQYYAILALAYWKNCSKDHDVQFNIASSTKYIRLGNNYNDL